MTFIWIILGIIALVIFLFALLWLNVIRASLKLNSQLDNMIAPAMKAVEEGSPSASDLVTSLAENPATRNYLFSRLREKGKVDVFPISYRTAEKVAESDMVRWLMHKNELGAAPAEIELVRSISVNQEGKTGTFFLFRFRTEESHWASERGWMAGVAGPFWDGDESMDSGSGTFSELKSFDELTEEQHIELLRAAVRKYGIVLPG